MPGFTVDFGYGQRCMRVDFETLSREFDVGFGGTSTHCLTQEYLLGEKVAAPGKVGCEFAGLSVSGVSRPHQHNGG